jgi:hypothetical protein
MTTAPDFRALCAELLEVVEGEYEGTGLCYELRDRANAALATPPPKPPTDEEIATAFQTGADQEFYAIVEALAEYCAAGVELTDGDVSEVLYELRRKQNTKTKPKPPTVMEILELSGEIEDAGLGQIDLVRAALERWGQR